MPGTIIALPGVKGAMPTKWFLVIFAVILCGPVSAQEPQSWTGHDKLALTHYFS